MASRATLVEVAAHAGVSLASTSRALHGTGASRAMVERVRAAAEELGYSADGVGRSLRMRRTFQIGFAVADIGNQVYVDMMTAIHEVAAPHGYRIVITTTGDTSGSTAELVRSLGASMVDGIIISPLRVGQDLIDAIAQSTVPVVVIGRALGDHGIESVSTDSAGGVGQAVQHLLSIGRRRIAFLNGPVDTTPGEARQRGFDAAVSGPGWTGELTQVEVGEDFTVAAGLAATRRLLDRADAGPGIDAVVAANDLLAIGAIRAARERGLRVPQDLAVTGMDDTEIGQVFEPGLTSVSLGSRERGRAAAEILLARLDGSDHSPEHIDVEPRLIVRGSTVAGAQEVGAQAPTQEAGE